jgi:glycosyltransferase involved in cell wall biosynthesis
MKIMTAMYTLKKGGAYDRFIMMVEAFRERKCEVHCLSLTPILVKHPYYHNHVVTLPFEIKNGLLVKIMVLLIFPLYSLLAGWREKVDLFVAFGPLYAFLQAVAKWTLKKPMVTLIRLDVSLGFKRQDLFNLVMFLNKAVEYLGLFFSDRIITVNTPIREEIIKVIGRWRKIEVGVLFNNVPEIKMSTPEDLMHTREEFGIPREAKMIVTAGVLAPRKNIEILLKSLSRLGREDLFLLIVGDSTQKELLHYRNYIETLIKKLGLGKRVMITGWVGKEELWKILGAADLFVLPSTKEGMPNALLEALGVGLPCMGSNIPGIKDILHYEDLMFDPLEEESLLQKIQGFFSDRQFFDKVMRLCQERKDIFVFDWKERVFEMITGTPTSVIK